jgi:hypothetical protein
MWGTWAFCQRLPKAEMQLVSIDCSNRESRLCASKARVGTCLLSVWANKPLGKTVLCQNPYQWAHTFQKMKCACRESIKHAHISSMQISPIQFGGIPRIYFTVFAAGLVS